MFCVITHNRKTKQKQITLTTLTNLPRQTDALGAQLNLIFHDYNNTLLTVLLLLNIIYKWWQKWEIKICEFSGLKSMQAMYTYSNIQMNINMRLWTMQLRVSNLGRWEDIEMVHVGGGLDLNHRASGIHRQSVHLLPRAALHHHLMVAQPSKWIKCYFACHSLK